MKRTLAFTVVTLLILIGASWLQGGGSQSPDNNITVVDGPAVVSTPAARRAVRLDAGTGSNTQDGLFANAFATETSAGEEFNWQNASTVSPGFSDRTGPPTLLSGGFNATPDELPPTGNALDVP